MKLSLIFKLPEVLSLLTLKSTQMALGSKREENCSQQYRVLQSHTTVKVAT